MPPNGVEWLLTQTIRAGQKSGMIDEDSTRRVAVDTTVMEKAIAHPTDARLHERARGQLVDLARGPGWSCGNPMPGSPRDWRCRWAATPMPGSSSACARH